MSETFLVCDNLDSFEDYWSIVSRMSLNWDNLSDVFLMIKLGLWVLERKMRERERFSSHLIKSIDSQLNLPLLMLTWITRLD